MRMGNRPIEDTSDIRNAYAQGWRFSLSSRESLPFPLFLPFSCLSLFLCLPLTLSFPLVFLYPPLRSLLPSSLYSTDRRVSLPAVSFILFHSLTPLNNGTRLLFISISCYSFLLLFPAEFFRCKLLIVGETLKFASDIYRRCVTSTLRKVQVNGTRWPLRSATFRSTRNIFLEDSAEIYGAYSCSVRYLRWYRTYASPAFRKVLLRKIEIGGCRMIWKGSCNEQPALFSGNLKIHAVHRL